MKISNRLKAVANLIPNYSHIIDVGCDHALLDIYLVNNKNVNAVASDINKEPLDKAKENIKKYNLANKIKLSLADGIENITKEINTIIISGMGTSNILNIIFKDKNKLANIDNIVISSNNDYYILRKTFTNNGYYIYKETIILENEKFYPIILFKKGNYNYSKLELEYGPILIKEKDDIFNKYLLKKLNKLNKINNNLSYKHIIRKIKIKLKTNQIKKLVRNN